MIQVTSSARLLFVREVSYGLWEPLLFKDVKMSRNFQSRVPPKCWDSLD